MSGVLWLVRQLARVLVGGVVLVLVVVGMPWLLLALTRPVLADPPDVAELVDEPLTAATLVLLAVAGAWMLWGWLLVGAVLDVLDRLRRPDRRRLRPPAPLYASVSAVVGTVALLLDGFSARAEVDAHPPAGGGPAATSTHTGGARAPRAEPAVGGFDVAGAGWLPLPAAAAGAVSALIWAQRRRLYEPRPPRGARRDDPDLAPLAAPSDADGRVTIGVADGSWLDLADLPPGGVRFTGAGAASALRGLLVTVLAAVNGPAVVAVAGELRSLLAADVDGVPGLHVVDTADAVPQVGAALVAAGHRVVVVRGRAGHPRAWLEAVDRAGLTVVGVGAEAKSPSWHVHADGTVARPAVRLAVLNSAAATVVVAGLRRAAAPAPSPVTSSAVDVPSAAAPRRLAVTILGQVRVAPATVDGDGTPIRFRRTASLHLLLLLAAHRDGVTGGDVAKALWPDQSPHAAARSLKTALHELRQTVQQATGVDVVDRAAILGGGSRYRLDPAHVDVDLWRFHDLIDAAHRSAGRTDRRTLLQQAADLEGGELAEGLTGGWLAPVREATARHSIDVLTYLADTEPDHGTALALLHRAARLAPDTETVQCALLRRYAAAGDLDGVHHAYQALRDRCVARASAPEPATTHLYQNLITADQAPTGAPERASR